MSFNPQQRMVIDVTANGSHFLIRCPMWCNELVRDLPSRRWQKSARAWAAPVIKQNVAEIERLRTLAGVESTPAAKLVLEGYHAKASAPKVAGGFPPWYKFKTQPRAHQTEALNKGYGLGAYGLFLPMQTGKTKTAIDMVTAHRMEGHVLGALIICKLTLRKNWVEQFGLHCPIEQSIYLPSTDRKEEFQRWMNHKHDFKVMIIGWESLSQGKMNELAEQFMSAHNQKVAIIGDEVTFITNHSAGRSKEAVKLAHMADYRYALTGTPAIEGPMNLYGIFEFLDTNIIGIGDFYAFRNRYAIMGGFMRPVGTGGKKVPTQIIGYQSLDELMGLIAPHTYQRKKEDIIDLPPKRRRLQSPQITKAQREIYDKVRKDGVLQHKGGKEHVLQNVLEVALRLHQVAGGYGVTPNERRWIGKDPKTGQPTPRVKIEYTPYALVEPEENPKMRDLMETVHDARTSQGIIWVVYRHEIAGICKLMRAANIRTGELHGGVAENDRQPVVNAFAKGDLQWIVANASTGGMGYTMMASEVNLFYNNTFKAIDRIQAEDRAWGEGQTKSGIWIDFAAEKTIDVTILKALAEKKDLSDYVAERIDHAIELLNGE